MSFFSGLSLCQNTSFEIFVRNILFNPLKMFNVNQSVSDDELYDQNLAARANKKRKVKIEDGFGFLKKRDANLVDAGTKLENSRQTTLPNENIWKKESNDSNLAPLISVDNLGKSDVHAQLIAKTDEIKVAAPFAEHISEFANANKPKVQVNTNDEEKGIYLVEKIIGHRRTPNGTVLYLTRWLGHDEAFDSWQPANSYLDGVPISQYLWGVFGNANN